MTTRSLRVDGTFDIECAHWDRFALGVVYKASGGYRVFYSLDELVDYLVLLKGTYWAHAGGIYDILAVVENLRKRGVKVQIDTAGHRITRAQFAGVTLRDSYSLLPFPLDDLADLAGEPVPKLPWKCVCRRKCGGYCRIGEMARRGEPDLEDYCIGDCRVLLKALLRLIDHAREHELELRGTIGGTAWATAKRELELPPVEMPWRLWRKIRAADKGGRSTIIRPFADGPGAHFDIVNAYPGALARAELPVGKSRELGGARARGALTRQRPGIYNVRVRVPEMLLPPLPWRHGGRINYPIGTFTGSWTLPELEAARARGAVIEEVYAAVIWEAAAPVFSGLMHDWYAIRRGVGKGTTLGHWQSRLAKALTGKLAEQPGRERTIVNPEKIRICPRTGRCARGCTRRCGAYQQLDLLGHVWTAPYWKIAENAHAHWSAYLRSLTRIQWLDAADRYAPGELCQGLTDSLWIVESNTTPTPLDENLGSWELENTFTELEIRGFGQYGYRDGSTGEFVVKGAPGLSEEDWRRGRAITDRGVMTLRQAVKGSRGLFVRRDRRELAMPARNPEQIWFGDRKLDPSIGITYPVTSEELRDRFKAGRATAAS